MRSYAILCYCKRNADGKESASELNATILAGRIEASGLAKVILKDERYTTVMANRIMIETGMKASRKKSVVDQIAAEIILQDYLEIILQDYLDHCMD